MLQHELEIDTAPFPISALINVEEFAPSQNKESFESRVVHESYRNFCLNLGGGKFGAAQAWIDVHGESLVDEGCFFFVDQ